MEQERQNTSAALTVSESAQENFKDFLEKLEKWFPTRGFTTKNAKLIAREKCAEVHIPFIGQNIIEEVVETFAKRGNVNILYAVSRENDKNIKVIAYSMPYSDEMYVISMESHQYGVIEEIVVGFYDSMDEMFQDLRHDYLAGKYMLEEPGAYSLEAEDYMQFCSHFL